MVSSRWSRTGCAAFLVTVAAGVCGGHTEAQPQPEADPLVAVAAALEGTCPFEVAIGPFEYPEAAESCEGPFAGDAGNAARRLTEILDCEPSRVVQVDARIEAARLRARAVWRLTWSRTAETFQTAIDELQRALALEPAQRDWQGDLAAIYFLRAGITDDPRDLLQALDLIERGEPSTAALRHNRRLILEALGFANLGDGPADRWAKRRREWQAGRLTTSDLVDDVGEHPQQIRELAEHELLAWWAEVLADAKEADLRLSQLAELGVAIERRNGEAALRRTIDQLRLDRTRQVRVGQAFLEFRSGVAAIRGLDYSSAAERLSRAARLLELESSPMAPWAEHYHAVAVFFSGDVESALQKQVEVLRQAHATQGLRSLEARALWSIAHMLMMSSRAPVAVDMAASARDVFAQLSEEENQAAVEFLLAEMLPSVGDEVGALRALTEASRRRGAITNLMRRHNIDMVWFEHARRAGFTAAARYFLTLLEQSAASLGDELSRFQVALLALSLAVDGNDLDRLERVARAHLAGIGDTNIRQLAEATLQVELATALLEISPQRAAALATAAADTFGRAEYHGEVAARLIGAVGAATIGNGEQARFGLALAVGRVSEIRAEVADPADRARYLADVERFSTIWYDAALRAGTDMELAWAGVAVLREAARGGGGPNLEIPTFRSASRSLEEGTLLVEYVSRDQGVEVWYTSRAGVDRESLDLPIALMRQLTRAWQRHRSPEVLVELGELLLGGVAARLSGHSRVVVVPPGSLVGIPWAGLQLPGGAGPLISRAEVVVAFSSFPQARVNLRPAGGLARALFIGDPAPRVGEASERLPGAAAEAEEASRWYPEAAVVQGADATVEALRERLAAQPTVVHIGAHTVPGDPLVGAERLLLAAGGGAGAAVDAEALAQLPFDGVRTVVLATCRGRGAPNSETGWHFDLVRALLAAGATEVLASDRDLDDRTTAALVVELHRHLALGASGATALRQVWLTAREPTIRSAAESFESVRRNP